MRAELIMIGTELLLGEIVDTNASFLARNLADLGIDVYYKSTVGDNLQRGAGVLAQALGRSDAVIISGGLGPTDDDLTREIVSEVMECPLQEDRKPLPSWKSGLLNVTARRKCLPIIGSRHFPQGKRDYTQSGGDRPWLLPREGRQDGNCPPWGLSGAESDVHCNSCSAPCPEESGRILVTRNLHFVGVGESRLAEILADLLREQTNPTLALYASGGIVRVRMAVKARSREEGLAMMAPVEGIIRSRPKTICSGRIIRAWRR